MPLSFRIGARTLWSLDRRLVAIALPLADVLARRAPALPPLGGADGWFVGSLPEAAVLHGADGMLRFERQRYARYFIDLASGFDTWWDGLSGNTRSGLRRKAKKLAEAEGGALDVRRYRTPDELETFHALARRVSATTYQERLLDAGLPDDPPFRAEMLAAAAAGRVRAWLLCVGGAPVAYLYCPMADGTVIYEYLGHDPRFAALSPGSVLQVEALRDLFADPACTHFDFTEGEGQHKRGLASGSVACVDVLLLRPTLANRALLGGLRAFDGAVAAAKRAVTALGLEGMARRVRRG